jgi:uncharacterized protein (DUF58 family)
MKKSSKYLDPATLSKVGGLELRARQVVEGYLAGLHRSPYHGWSVEFAEHRPYSLGDELRHIDWRLWARSDRLFVKLYEEETNVRAHFLVDASRSMAYASGELSKYAYGCTLAASLAYLLLMQRDAVGLMTFGDGPRDQLPPTAHPGALGSFCRLLEDCAPTGATNLGAPLHRMADQMSRRGLVLLVSDLLAPLSDLRSALHRFRYDGHAVILLHIVDPAERDFPFDGNVQFAGTETPTRIRADAQQIRGAYLEGFQRFGTEVRRMCDALEVDYLRADTDGPPDAALMKFLASRATGY